jgi:hypothetical protein
MSSLGDAIFSSLRTAYGIDPVTTCHAADEPNDKVVMVMVKDIYGRRTVYPVCPQAKIFAQIAGTTTLTPQVVGLIKDLGYRVNIDQPEVSL